MQYNQLMQFITIIIMMHSWVACCYVETLVTLTLTWKVACGNGGHELGLKYFWYMSTNSAGPALINEVNPEVANALELLICASKR